MGTKLYRSSLEFFSYSLYTSFVDCYHLLIIDRAVWLKACFKENVLIHGIAIQGGGDFAHYYAQKYRIRYDFDGSRDVFYKEKGAVKVCLHVISI